MASIIEQYRDEPAVKPTDKLKFGAFKIEKGELGGWGIVALDNFGSGNLGYEGHFSTAADLVAWLSKSIQD